MNYKVIRTEVSTHNIFDFEDSVSFWKSLFPELTSDVDFLAILKNLGEIKSYDDLYDIFINEKQNKYIIEAADYEIEYTNTIKKILEDIDKKINGWSGFFYPLILTYSYEFYQYINSSTVINNKKELFKSIIQNVSAKLFQMSFRVLVAETNNYRINNLLIGNDEYERAKYFKKFILTKEKNLEKIYSKYCVLSDLLVYCIENTFSFVKEIINNYKNDVKKIERVLNSGKTLGKIKFVELGVGDTHNSGRSVVKVIFENGELIYKPRNIDIESSFNKFISFFNDKHISNFLDIKIVNHVGFENHGWFNLISSKQCQTIEEVKSYYLRMGELLAIFYILGTTDLHSENIIAQGEYPIIIDLETLFSVGFVKKEIINETITNYIANKISKSVRSSAILPMNIRNKKLNTSADLSGLSMDNKQMSPFKSHFLIDADKDTISVVSDFSIMDGNNNIVLLNDEIKPSNEYIKFIIAGFKTVYDYICRHKEEIIAVIEESFADSEYRVLMRDTMTYSQLLTSSYHPDLLQSSLDRKIYFHRLYLDTSNDFHDVVKSEYCEMLKADIPLFNSRTTLKGLYSSNCQCGNDIIVEIALEKSKSIIMEMGENDYLFQERVINYSYSDVYRNSIFKTNFYFDDNKIVSIKKDEILSKIEQLAELIINNSILIGDKENRERSWLGYIEVEKSFRQLSPVGINVYDGNTGIALFFAALYNVTKKEKYRSYCIEILNPVQRYLKRFNPEIDKQNGFYNGYFGVIYSLTLVSKLINSKSYLDLSNKLISSITSENVSSNNFDIIMGNAGALLTLLRLNKHDEYDSLINILINSIFKEICVSEHGIYFGKEGYTGFAHGTAGISHLIYEQNKKDNNKDFKRVVSELIRFERNMFDYDNQNYKKDLINQTYDYKWCHGLPGILVNRLNLYKQGYRDNNIEREIKTGICGIKEKGFGFNYCLCHGDLGNLMILKKAALTMHDDNLVKAVELNSLNISDLIFNKIFNDDVFIKYSGFGLMTGLSGIGYSLLYLLFNDKEIPNILAL